MRRGEGANCPMAGKSRGPHSTQCLMVCEALLSKRAVLLHSQFLDPKRFPPTSLAVLCIYSNFPTASFLWIFVGSAIQCAKVEEAFEYFAYFILTSKCFLVSYLFCLSFLF